MRFFFPMVHLSDVYLPKFHTTLPGSREVRPRVEEGENFQVVLFMSNLSEWERSIIILYLSHRVPVSLLYSRVWFYWSVDFSCFSTLFYSFACYILCINNFTYWLLIILPTDSYIFFLFLSIILCSFYVIFSLDSLYY